MFCLNSRSKARISDTSIYVESVHRLNLDQELPFRVVQSGHNALITGKAGTGKSFLVQEIFKSLVRSGKRVRIVCSSGIAGRVYTETNACTVHSFYRLRTAELQWKQLVERSCRDSQTVQNNQSLDCLIWDEVSMSSRRMLELANSIHLHVNKALQNPMPFGGIQLLLVGDFQQLRPVPSLFDKGQFMFQSPIFQQAIPHRFKLTQSMRQDESEKEFLACLDELRAGTCSKESEIVIQGLKRELLDELEEQATHIFFRKVPTRLFNLTKLSQLGTEEDRFEAVDSGNTDNIDCAAEKTLVLKPGCKVMLIWNKSAELRNGSAGIYVGKNGCDIVVDFEMVGEVKLKNETWEKRSKHGEVVGTRTQFSVILGYAITCHKGQGLTIPSVVVHSSKEFTPGLLYVAFTRVKSSQHLRVLNFHTHQLIPPVQECVNISDPNQEEMNVTLAIEGDFSCCRHKILPAQSLEVNEDTTDYDSEAARDHALDELNERTEQIVTSFFERGESDDLMLDLETVYAVLADDSSHDFLRTPPESFSVRAMLESMKVAEPLSEYADNKNRLIEELLENNETIDVFGKVLWCKACQIILEESLLADDLRVHISSKQWSLDTRELYMMLSRSADFLSLLKLFFGTTEMSDVQVAVGNELMICVYGEVVEKIAVRVKECRNWKSCNNQCQGNAC